jgi:ABC-type lipoprotein export system ATPase subunit
VGIPRYLTGEPAVEKNAGASLVNNEGMQERIIELRGVEKSYPQGGGQVFVLRRVDVVIEEGEFVSVMGPSGAGKSTLLHILGIHDSEFTGEYYLLGEPVHKLGRKPRHELQKRAIGFVFQSYHLLDELTVAENLELPLSYRNLKNARRSWPTRSTASRSSARRISTRASSRAGSSSSWPSRARSSRAPS